jgi:hypothetical protein
LLFREQQVPDEGWAVTPSQDGGGLDYSFINVTGTITGLEGDVKSTPRSAAFGRRYVVHVGKKNVEGVYVPPDCRQASTIGPVSPIYEHFKKVEPAFPGPDQLQNSQWNSDMTHVAPISSMLYGFSLSEGRGELESEVIIIYNDDGERIGCGKLYTFAYAEANKNTALECEYTAPEPVSIPPIYFSMEISHHCTRPCHHSSCDSGWIIAAKADVHCAVADGVVLDCSCVTTVHLHWPVCVLGEFNFHETMLTCVIRPLCR